MTELRTGLFLVLALGAFTINASAGDILLDAKLTRAVDAKTDAESKIETKYNPDSPIIAEDVESQIEQEIDDGTTPPVADAESKIETKYNPDSPVIAEDVKSQIEQKIDDGTASAKSKIETKYSLDSPVMAEDVKFQIKHKIEDHDIDRKQALREHAALRHRRS